MTSSALTVTRPRPLLRLAGWLLLTVLVVMAARKLDWPRTVDAIGAAAPAWLAAAIAANAMILVLWAGFWRALLPLGERTSFGVMLSITTAASALMNTFPFLGGHASSVVLLVKQGGVSRHGALSVLALDQLGEGVAKLLIFASVALLAPIPAWMRAGILTSAVAVSALFAFLTALAYRHRIHAAEDDSPSFVARWAHGLDVLRSWRRAANALVCVVAMKAVEAVAILAVQRAFGIHLPVSGTLLVLAAVVLGTMIPLSPGNIGTYEAGVFLAYRHLGIAPEQAAALALVQHLCFALPAIAPGYVMLSFAARRPIASS